MKPIEEELKESLRRVEPSSGFTERVMARAKSEAKTNPGPAGRFLAWFRPQPVRWAVAFGLACLLMVFGAVKYRERQQAKIQSEMARAQVRLALHIASAKLNAAFKDAAQPNRHNLEN